MKTAHKARQTGVLGLLGIHPDRVSDPYFAQILHGVQSEAFACGRQVLQLDTQPSIPWREIDAILLVGRQSTFLSAKPAHVPCVSLLYQAENLPSVVVDDFEGARQATERLIGLGHERIAYLTLTEHPIASLRVEGYRRALSEAGVTAAPEWMRGLPYRIFQQDADRQLGEPRKHMYRWGYSFMRTWLQTDWEKVGCTALLTQNDHVAVGALAAFQEVGVQVPADVSLVGFDDSVVCETTTPTLSSIAIPLFEVGAAGVRSLLREEGRAHSKNQCLQDTPETVVLPARFQARDSIGAAP